jgi:hypothetical protein
MRIAFALSAFAILGLAESASAQYIAAPPGNAEYGRGVFVQDNRVWSRYATSPYSTVIAPNQYAAPRASVGYGFGTTFVPNTLGSPWAANWNMYPTTASLRYVTPPPPPAAPLPAYFFTK